MAAQTLSAKEICAVIRGLVFDGVIFLIESVLLITLVNFAEDFRFAREVVDFVEGRSSQRVTFDRLFNRFCLPDDTIQAVPPDPFLSSPGRESC